MSYGAETIKIHKNLRLDKRKGSTNWYARLTLDNGKRVIKSTGTDSFEDAKEHAMRLYYETQARIANKLPASTRKFKAVAEHTIQRMQADEAAGVGKQAYRDYQQALRRWLIPYFGATDIAKVDLAGLTAFDQWRTKELGRVPAQSTINNHNAALNRVLDEAELRGWITKSLRPTLLNKGVETQSRGSYTVAEYTSIVAVLRTWHTKTDKVHAKATRNVLRNYVLFLANTGIRHGTEALGLKWKNIEWHTGSDKEPYLRISVYGKTKGHRGHITPASGTRASAVAEAWQVRRSAQGTSYRIARDHDLVASILDRVGPLKSDILVLLRLIEETVPVQRIWLDTAEDKETPRTGFAGAPDSEVMETLSSMFDALVKFRGLSPAEARERLGRTPPFDRHLDLVAALEVKDAK